MRGNVQIRAEEERGYWSDETRYMGENVTMRSDQVLYTIERGPKSIDSIWGKLESVEPGSGSPEYERINQVHNFPA
jgi:hypothetical protein